MLRIYFKSSQPSSTSYRDVSSANSFRFLVTAISKQKMTQAYSITKQKLERRILLFHLSTTTQTNQSEANSDPIDGVAAKERRTKTTTKSVAADDAKVRNLVASALLNCPFALRCIARHAAGTPRRPRPTRPTIPTRQRRSSSSSSSMMSARHGEQRGER